MSASLYLPLLLLLPLPHFSLLSLSLPNLKVIECEMAEEVVGIVQGCGAELAQGVAAARPLLLPLPCTHSPVASVSHVLSELLACEEHLLGDEDFAEFETKVAVREDNGEEKGRKKKMGVGERLAEKDKGEKIM